MCSSFDTAGLFLAEGVHHGAWSAATAWRRAGQAHARCGAHTFWHKWVQWHCTLLCMLSTRRASCCYAVITSIFRRRTLNMSSCCQQHSQLLLCCYHKSIAYPLQLCVPHALQLAAKAVTQGSLMTQHPWLRCCCLHACDLVDYRKAVTLWLTAQPQDHLQCSVCHCCH